MTFTSRCSNSGLIRAMYPSSVVHTGVKSFGCENSTAQESPIHSWKRIGPWVVAASKSGAVSPICSAISLYLLGSFLPVSRPPLSPRNGPARNRARETPEVRDDDHKGEGSVMRSIQKLDAR